MSEAMAWAPAVWTVEAVGSRTTTVVALRAVQSARTVLVPGYRAHAVAAALALVWYCHDLGRRT